MLCVSFKLNFFVYIACGCLDKQVVYSSFLICDRYPELSGYSVVEEGRIPGVAVKCVEIGWYTRGDGILLVRELHTCALPIDSHPSKPG